MKTLCKASDANKKLNSKQYTLKSKIVNDAVHCQHERNNPMIFQFNNIYYRNINVKSYT